MSCSVDGYIADREGDFGWGVPDDELFRFHTERVGGLSGYLIGRRLYEMMLPWENDPAMRSDEAQSRFADIWCALPKIVFSRTLDHVEGNARLATAPLADEIAAARTNEQDFEIGGADLAGQAIELGLVDELRIFRHPVLVGGGTPLLPPVTDRLPLDLIETRTFGSQVVYERYGRGETT